MMLARPCWSVIFMLKLQLLRRVARQAFDKAISPLLEADHIRQKLDALADAYPIPGTVGTAQDKRATYGRRMCRIGRFSSSRSIFLLLDEGLGAFRQFCRSNIFLMCCNKPAVSEWILYAAAAIAIEHVGRLHDFCAAGLDRPLKNAVHIRNV